MREFFKIITGNANAPQFWAALFFAYLTAFALLLYRTTKRDINSKRTPFHFSWSFLLNDNSRRIVANALLIFIAVRILQLWIGAEYTAYAGFIVGLVADQLAALYEFLADQLRALFRKKVRAFTGEKDETKSNKQ